MYWLMHLVHWFALLFYPSRVAHIWSFPKQVLTLSEMLQSAEATCVRKAIAKGERDPVISKSHPNVQWLEALEWSSHFAAEEGLILPRDHWKTKVLLEFLMGERQGLL